MNYRTTCPQCLSVFRLGADQLAAAQGWVQCSVCGAAFDARVNLLLEDGSPLPPEPAEAAAPEAFETRAPATEPVAEPPAPEPEAAPVEEAPEAEQAAPVAPSAPTPVGIAQRESSPDLPSIILIDPDAPPPDDLGPEPQIGKHADEDDTHLPPMMYPAAPRRAVETPAATEREPAAPPATRTQPEHDYPSAPPPRQTPRWVWGVTSALLVVLLVAQTAFFLRDAVVSRLPQTRPAFEAVCALAGCTLSLPKNLALLQIVGSDLQTETGGRLRLSLTLGNRANHVQAWPVLVLTLTDQKNRPLARRSFAPSEYLEDPRRIAAGIPPRSEQALALPLTVRQLAPMGFDLKLSY